MYVYLMRHGEAQPGMVDAERALTTHGEQQVQEQANYLLEQKKFIDCLYHSGYRRAEQTANILAQAVKPNSLALLKGLCPQDAVEEVLQEIAAWTQPTLLVGHLPHLAYLAFALGQAEVEFRPATLAVLQRRPGGVWCLQALRHAKG